MGAVRFSIDPELVRELKSLLPLRIFVETGTYEGASVRAVRSLFDELHTVELSTKLYADAAEAFADDEAVHVHHAPSQDLLAQLAPKLRRRGVLYWLDAHWSDEEHSEGAAEQCPLLAELQAIGSISDRSVVLIDDARLFLSPPPAPAQVEGWPRFDEVIRELTALNPEHELMVIDDVIVFFPARVREELRDFAHRHAVDWLAELQAGRRAQLNTRRLESLESDLAEFRKETATQNRRSARQLDRKVETLAGTIRDLRKELATLGDRPETEKLAPLGEQLESFGPQLNALGRSLRNLRAQSDESQTLLEELPAAREEIKALEQRVDPIDTNLDSLGSLVERLHSDLRELDARAKESSQRLGELPGTRDEIKSLERRIEPLDTRIASVSSLLENMRAEVRSVEAEVLRELEAESERTREALVDIPRTRSDVAALASRVEGMATEIEELRPRIDDDLRLQSHRSEVALERLGTLMRQVRSLEQQLAEKPKPERLRRTRRFLAASRRRWRYRLRRLGRGLRMLGRTLLAPFRWLGMKLFASSLGSLNHHAPRELRIPGRYRREIEVEAPPRISIVTASDGRASWLDRTVRSVLDQDYEPLEYIVEEFASTEASARVLKRHRSRLAYCEIRRNGGAGPALNVGFDRATGDVLGHLASNTILLPGALAYVAQYFERHPEVDVVYGHRVLIDEKDREIGRWVLPRHDDEVLSWADFVPPESLFWRRSVWEASGGEVDPSLSEAMDWELLLRFREVGARMARVPRFLGAYRIRHIEQRAQRHNGAVTESDELRELRARIHGRPVSEDEAERAIRGYVRRHVLLQKLYRLHLLRY